ncbi:MAG TPA: hypothetical protein VJH05_02320 [Candidatus Paceibacterota bacterium]
MKIFIVILIFVAAAIFLPIYNGRVICGINPEGGCWNKKVNLIEYFKQNGFELKEKLK